MESGRKKKKVAHVHFEGVELTSGNPKVFEKWEAGDFYPRYGRKLAQQTLDAIENEAGNGEEPASKMRKP